MRVRKRCERNADAAACEGNVRNAEKKTWPKTSQDVTAFIIAALSCIITESAESGWPESQEGKQRRISTGLPIPVTAKVEYGV